MFHVFDPIRASQNPKQAVPARLFRRHASAIGAVTRCAQFVTLPFSKTNLCPIFIGTWMDRPGNLAWWAF